MEIILTQPDDWHVHLRDNEMLSVTLPFSATQFARAIIMPNLSTPVTTVEKAKAYRQRILDALPEGLTFEPLMTLYLTDHTSPDEIHKAIDSGFVKAVKLYPVGATTHSDAGVSDLAKCDKVLGEMERLGFPLLLHGEVATPSVDVFDREKVFIDKVLQPLLRRYPALRVVLEHVTTLDAVEFVKASGNNVAATITAHHLLYNRNSILAGGIRPHYYCLPVLKKEHHRQAVMKAAASGHSRFFLGTDSAPHASHVKEAACGYAGCFTAPVALLLYAEAFEAANALDQLEAFASFNGPDFYQLPRNKGKVMLRKEKWSVPYAFSYSENQHLIPLRAGEVLQWKFSGRF